MAGEVGVAVVDRVESRLRAERGEPWRPHMGGDEVAAQPALERGLQQIAGVEPQDRPAVGGEIADLGQAAGDLADRVEVGCVEEVVHLPRAVGALVDRGDLGREQEPDGRPAGQRQAAQHPLLDLVAQPVETWLGRHELAAQLVGPGRVGEVAGPDDADALAGSPPREVFQIAVAAAGTGVLGVDVQVGVEPHGGGSLRIRRGSHEAARRRHPRDLELFFTATGVSRRKAQDRGESRAVSGRAGGSRT